MIEHFYCVTSPVVITHGNEKITTAGFLCRGQLVTRVAPCLSSWLKRGDALDRAIERLFRSGLCINVVPVIEITDEQQKLLEA